MLYIMYNLQTKIKSTITVKNLARIYLTRCLKRKINSLINEKIPISKEALEEFENFEKSTYYYRN